MNPDQFEDKVYKSEACIIDVRTAQEYADGHFYRAVNIDWQKEGFMDEVEQGVLSLADTPTIGKIDPLFAHRKQTYRSIIVRRKNKIVYYIKDDTINIAAFWDTRREPKSLIDELK